MPLPRRTLLPEKKMEEGNTEDENKKRKGAVRQPAGHGSETAPTRHRPDVLLRAAAGCIVRSCRLGRVIQLKSIQQAS